ncbi:MAG TPA: hypothetical protein VL992_13045, partial [Tepidisphaeraceae bacterium]|nr:hypothetical protein [Tepidisphaeraceae bacterium]
FLTAVLVMALEPGLYPPGFTGEGAYAMLAIFIGAFHLAGRTRQPWMFLIFGALGAMLLLADYIGGRDRGSAGAAVGWIVFVVAVSLITRMTALVRWRMIREGRAKFRWLAERVLKVALALGIPLAVVCGWLYWRSEWKIVETLHLSDEDVDADCDIPIQWQWTIGPATKFFEHVTQVSLEGPAVHDEQVGLLADLPRLQELHLKDATVTEAGLVRLTGLSHLEHLYMPGAAIDDEALRSVARLVHLVDLDLSGTKITDTGMPNLARLPLLESLWLDNTAISDRAISFILQLKNLHCLSLNATAISNGGLMKLIALHQLGCLWVKASRVTPQGLIRFKQLRPDVDVNES